MAYNQFFPQGYGMYNPYNQNFQQGTQQIQNGGFVSVRSMEEALGYPVAPGNSITFKDENAPYVYTKTRGFSQLDQPIFEKYRLVKEENIAPEPRVRPQDARNYDDDIKLLWDEINVLKGQIEAQNEHAKKEDGGKDAESE